MPTQKSFSPADPAIVPVEGPVLKGEGNAAAGREGKRERRTAVQINPYGQNNEQLPERLEGALRRLAISIFVRIGRNAAAGSAQDQTGAPILAWLAVLVVERTRPELAPAV